MKQRKSASKKSCLEAKYSTTTTTKTKTKNKNKNNNKKNKNKNKNKNNNNHNHLNAMCKHKGTTEAQLMHIKLQQLQ